MSQRPRGRCGQGSVYKRSDGKWQGQLSTVAADGKRTRQTFTRTTQEAVVAKLHAAATALRKGGTVPGGTADLRPIRQARRPRDRSRTDPSRGYCQLLGQATGALGRIPLVRLAPSDLMRQYDERRKAGAKPLTVLHLHRAIYRCLRDAERWCECAEECRAARRCAEGDPTRDGRLTGAEARRLLEAAKGDRLEALLVLALTSGARQGEVLGLSWRDVDLDAGTISNRASLVPTSHGLQLLEPKTARSQRRIEIEPRLVATLRRHRAAQEMERRVRRRCLSGLRPRLLLRDRTSLDRQHVTVRWFRPLLARGLPLVRWDASVALAQGVHPKVVQEALGHSTIAVTVDLYSHSVPSLGREAARTMGAALFG